MRIGIDIRSLGEENQSGVAEYTNNLLLHLFQIDKKNKYLLFINSFKNGCLDLLKERFNFTNVEVKSFFIPNKLLNSSLLAIEYPKIDRLLHRTGVDVFFAPNLQFMALSRQGKKVVTVHDLSFKLYPKFYSFKKRLWHRLVNPGKIYRDFHQIIAVSEHTKNDLIKFYQLPEQKIKVIYSGVNLTDYQQVNKHLLPTIVSKYQLPENFILTLSTLEPRKNISGVLLAFDELFERYNKDIYLVIDGDKGWNCREIERTYNQIRNKKRVKFIGYVDKKDKAYLYHLARVFVYPSFYEGFGFPPLESLASGTPVIASANSALPEVLGEAAWFVDPYNINEIQQALYLCLTDEQLRTNLKNKGLAVAQRFDWGTTAQQTLNLFKKL